MKSPPARSTNLLGWWKIIFWCALALFFVPGKSLQAALLLKYNFEGSNTWTSMAGYFQTATGSGAATPTVTTVGTVNGYGTASNTDVNNTASNGIKLVVDSSSATGTWTAGVSSGVLSLLNPNTISNQKLGLLTLSFSLWSSNANPILVRVESYDGTTNLRTGGLKTLIYPAAPNFYQRYAIDLSTMTADGTGTFIPDNSSKIKVYFEIGNTLGGDGWPNASGLELHIDNVNYASPKYYVAPTTFSPAGNDNNSGTVETAPWATIDKAVNAAVAGDIIALRGSEASQFVASPDTNGLASFENSGTPDAWIVLKNYPGETPILRSAGWNVVYIGRGSNVSRYAAKTVPCYIEVRGLTVRGYSSVDANGDRQIAANYKTYVGQADSRSNSNGISIDGRYCDYYLHDYRIANNIVEYCTGGGLNALRTDRTAFENNIARYNTWWSIYGGSGISYLVSIDSELNSDYRMLLQGNLSYGNEGMIPWRSVNGFSDGNGIIVDTNQLTKSTYNFSNAPDYAGRTLVQNNLVYNNGGSGIHSFQSSHVDIVHNTAYHNSASPRLLYSEIFAGYSKDVRMMNNILVAPNNPTGDTNFNEPITSDGSNTAGTIYYQNNVFYGEGNNKSLPTNVNYTNNSTTNPLFLSPSIDPSTSDFHLRFNSPALNNGLNIAYRLALDYAGRPRLTTNLTPDRGAYQTQTSDVYAPVFTPQPGNYASAQSVTLATDTSGAKIIYTTNGTAPAVDGSGNATNGSVYSSAISVGPSASTLKAITWKAGVTSYVSTASYTFNTMPVAIPALSFDVSPTTSDGTQYVNVLCATPGALVRYTLDGTNPTTTAGTLATNAGIKVNTANIIKAIAYLSGRSNSAVLTGNFVIRAALGNLTEGTLATFGANSIRFSRFQPTSLLTATKIYAKVGATTGSYRTAIYSGTSTAPTALLKASSNVVTNPAAGWQTFSLTSALDLPSKDSNGNDLYYWLAIWSDNAAGGIYLTSTGGTLSQVASTFSSTWPATISGATSVGSANYSIFATTSYRPVVAAGSNQSLTYPTTTASLTGTATDNSSPAVPLAAGSLTTGWSKISGPGTVTFATSTALSTSATFSQAGTYVLRLTGQDVVFTPFAPVTSDVTITVGSAPVAAVTTTSLVSSGDMKMVGASVTLTATVTNATATPTGTVTFYDGSVSLGTGTLNASGIATLTTTALPVGIHSLTAVYAGNSTYATSTSQILSQTTVLADGTTRLLAINAAGPAINGSGFAADAGFTGGSTISASATIDLSAVTSPAPQAVYQAERYGTFNYTFNNLTPFAPCLVRLHFSENYHGVGTHTATVGQRLFNVAINGTTRLSSFDIWAAAGASNKAVIKEFNAAADESGKLSLDFAALASSPDVNALVDGLEVYTVTPFDSWRVTNFTPNQLDDPTISGPAADYDGDGLNTLMEYALDTDPLTPDLTSLPVLDTNDQGHLTLAFPRVRSELTYIVEGSSDLAAWTALATNPGTVGETVTVEDNPPVNATKRFMRLHIFR